MRFNLQGIDLRIVQGEKFPGDLRLEHRTREGWVPTKMSLALFLVDFFAENEQERRLFMSFWKHNGDTYFLDKCVRAVKVGWDVVASEIDAQRRRRAS
jgi:hypothetical protein